MEQYRVSATRPGTKKYPMHRHGYWEIMYYLSGEGYLVTDQGAISFRPGSIIVVPPGIRHGSVSDHGFVNISIGGTFDRLFLFTEPQKQQDNDDCDGQKLAKLILDNQHTDSRYVAALCSAYAHFLLQNARYECRLQQQIAAVVRKTHLQFHDSGFHITSELRKSGYSEDYIRSEFKKSTGMTPVDFLTKIRIDNGAKLFEIYSQSISVGEVGEACGFVDMAYFSKCFKKQLGVSPTEYRRRCS